MKCFKRQFTGLRGTLVSETWVYLFLLEDVFASNTALENGFTEKGTTTPRPYVEQESSASIAADPIVQYMSRPQLEKSIERTRKLMQEAAKKLDFIEAAQYRDELLKMEDLLKEKA